MAKTKLTSVKVPEDLFEEFQVDCVRVKFSTTKLLERAMYLYLKDKTFKQRIHDTLDTTLK